MPDTTNSNNDSGPPERGSATDAGQHPDVSRGRVALFVTCLVDLYRPRIGFAAAALIERAGYAVEVPPQGCCGQPNFNSGDRDGAREIARRMIARLGSFDYIVAPSGSCAAMLRVHYPALFPVDSNEWHAATALAEKVFELTDFLYTIGKLRDIPVKLDTTVTYHDSCSGLRELGVARQPRELLRSIPGVELREMNQPDACCGFGGLFCMKYPQISERIAGSKIRDILATDAKYVVAGDLGCLLQIGGSLERGGHAVTALHVAELLAGEVDEAD